MAGMGHSRAAWWIAATASVALGAGPAVAGTLALSSPAFVNGGTLPAEYTCDGGGVSPPLAWSGAPAGTAELALVMDHWPHGPDGPDPAHWYWIITAIPADADGLAAGNGAVGITGSNSHDPRPAYAPPCSRGPGPKLYTITLYALSAAPVLADPRTATRDEVLDAIAGITLDSAALSVTYAHR